MLVEASEDKVLDASSIGSLVGVDGKIVECVVQDDTVAQNNSVGSIGEIPLLLEAAGCGVGGVGLQSLGESDVAVEGPGAGSSDTGSVADSDGPWAERGGNGQSVQVCAGLTSL